MPWCEHCAKFWNPATLTVEGACPSCGRSLARAEQPPATPPPTLSGADLRKMAGEDARAPWHFKLMVVALAVYLSWRVVQLVLGAVH